MPNLFREKKNGEGDKPPKAVAGLAGIFSLKRLSKGCEKFHLCMPIKRILDAPSLIAADVFPNTCHGDP
jgi:hypothetical protein